MENIWLKGTDLLEGAHASGRVVRQEAISSVWGILAVNIWRNWKSPFIL